MFGTTSGLVGIGTIYTGWRLNVDGAIRAQRIDLTGSAGPGHVMLRIDDNGTVLRNNTFNINSGNGNAGQSANLAVGNTDTTVARLYVKGSGSTSATTSLLVQNSGGTQALKIKDDGAVILGNTTDFGVLYVPRSSTYAERVFMTMESGVNLLSTYSNDGLGFKANYNIFDGSIFVSTGYIAGKSTGSATNTNAYTLATQLNPYASADSCLINLSGGGRLQGGAYGQYIRVEGSMQLDSSINQLKGFYFNPTLSGAYSTQNVLAIHSTYGGAYLNTATPQASAILQADSTTQGFLSPRMTTAEKNLIATPANGLIVYDTTLARPCFFNGATWITL